MMTNDPPFTRGDGQRILLVDDEADILDLMGLFLSGIGYSVESFISSPKALDRLQSHPSDFDIVLTDLVMPGLTGLEFAQRVRDLRLDLPVILITGHRKALESCGTLPGAICDVLIKPFDLAFMAKCIAKQLARKAH